MTEGDLLLHCRATRRRIGKWAHYIPIYDRLLSAYRGRALTLVEIGVGDGGSLEAWRRYLGSSARIIGIDLNPAAKRLESDGFEIIVGDQSDPEFWARHLPGVGPIDVLIDDGGHSNVEQIVTVACALPHVRDGGLIVVEDTHTAYLPKHYPAARRFGFMQFAQHVVDVLHGRNPFVTEPVADTAGLGRAIHSVQFFESMVVFYVDRGLCGPSEGFEAGSEDIAPFDPAAGTLRSRAIDALESLPTWLRSLLQPGRRVAGAALRASRRIAGANRVKRYFR